MPPRGLLGFWILGKNYRNAQWFFLRKKKHNKNQQLQLDIHFKKEILGYQPYQSWGARTFLSITGKGS